MQQLCATGGQSSEPPAGNGGHQAVNPPWRGRCAGFVPVHAPGGGEEDVTKHERISFWTLERKKKGASDGISPEEGAIKQNPGPSRSSTSCATSDPTRPAPRRYKYRSAPRRKGSVVGGTRFSTKAASSSPLHGETKPSWRRRGAAGAAAEAGASPSLLPPARHFPARRQPPARISLSLPQRFPASDAAAREDAAAPEARPPPGS